MKLYSEEEVRQAIRFGFERSSLLDEGKEFIASLEGMELKPCWVSIRSQVEARCDYL